MDVKRKVALSCVYESYWDMLSPEIQEYILEFKFSQEQIDEAREALMSQLRQEIALYRRVKVKWRLGHVRCTASRTKCEICDVIHPRRVYGHYKDVANVKKWAFLGYGLGQAVLNVDDARISCAPYIVQGGVPDSFQDPPSCNSKPSPINPLF